MTTPPTPLIPPASGTPPAYEQVIVPPAPQQHAGYPPAPSQIYAPPLAPRSGNTAVKIILIVVGIFVLLGVLTAAIIGFGVYKVSKAVNLHSIDSHNKDGGVSFSTPAGDFSTGSGAAITSADLGLPIYPGATATTGSMKMKTPNGALITAVYTTPDSQAKVVDFYKEKMGSEASIMEGGNSTILTAGEHRRDKTVVTITTDDTNTKIALMHATGTER